MLLFFKLNFIALMNLLLYYEDLISRWNDIPTIVSGPMILEIEEH